MAEKKSRSFVEQRRQTILRLLREKGRVGVSELSEKLGISTLTVRRDLDELEGRGLVSRRYGEAVLVESEEMLGGSPAYSPCKIIKERIAEAAAGLVADNELVFVNTSSTALATVKYIKSTGVTIVTNSMHGQDLPVPEGGIILVTGGEVRPPRGVLSGEFALANIRSVAASTCFVGCGGISLTAGVTSTTQQEAIVNSLMVERSDRLVLVAASNKLGVSAGFSYADLSQINLLITDKDATDEDVEVLLDAGIHEIRRV